MSGPITVEYYYRVRWGALDEFIELFERNHWPILREQLAARLFPDRERHAAEERRRFELLEAHWDVPLEDHPLPYA